MSNRIIKWFKKLFEEVTCDDCIHRSAEKVQSPAGGHWYYCMHPCNSDTKFSYTENCSITKSYPCDHKNEFGWCRLHEVIHDKGGEDES